MIKEIHPPNKIYIKFIDKKKGWGVFCKEKILKDEIVEYCYGIIDNYNTSALKDYTFTLNEKNLNAGDVIHSLGYGGVYNHNDEPNVKWDVIGNIIKFTAIQDIEIDQEICTYYGAYYLETFKTRFI
jgi:SET domain-containing protein